MPKPRKNQQIQCCHFLWRLLQRNGVWYADGRSNTHKAGRHSLNTRDEKEARRRLANLDRIQAEKAGLRPRSPNSEEPAEPLSLEKGRHLYEDYIKRPRVTGGVKESTARRYKPVFDKFLPFAKTHGITTWNGVTADLLMKYAGHLEQRKAAPKTQSNELITLKQAINWLIKSGHLRGTEPIDMPLRQAESEPAYCYRPEEVKAMLEYSKGDKNLGWLYNVIIGLACTGLRISELASLRWSDWDKQTGRLILTDESGRKSTPGRENRTTKNSRGRSFPVHPELEQVLKSIPREGEYIFKGPRGRKLKSSTALRNLQENVIKPLSDKFPTRAGEKGFSDGCLHSFRHAFCSTCANNGVPERIVMSWLGHQASRMIRHYYHLHDDEARRQMNKLNFTGNASGRSTGDEKE